MASTRANVVITAQDRTRQAFDQIRRRMQGMQSATTGLVRSVTALAGGVGFALLVRNAARAAEEIRSLDARIRRATDALGDYNRVSRELYEISQRNGTALVETGNLFISIQRAAEDLGRSRGDVLQLTDTIQQLGVISGASGEAMKNSLRQFSQAMAGGVVRAEEFNSIIENTPEIAARIAKGMGLSVGQLRLAVVEGRVLSEDVFASLLGQAAEIESDFSKMPLTIGRAWQMLTNSLSRFVSLGNEATETTSGIAGAIQRLSGWIDELNRKITSGEIVTEFKLWGETFETFRIGVGSGVDWIKAKFDGLLGAGGIDWGEFFKDLPALTHIAFVEVFGIVDRAIATISSLWLKLLNSWDGLWLDIKASAERWWESIKGIFRDDDTQDAVLGALEERVAEEKRVLAEERRVIDEAYEARVAASREAIRAIREEQFARMDSRRELTENARQVADNIAAWEVYEGALSDATTTQKAATKATEEQTTALKGLHDMLSGFAVNSLKELTTEWNKWQDAIEGRYTASMDSVLDLWDKLIETVPGFGKAGTKAVDDVKDSLFDMDEALKQVQNNIQSGFSDLFADIFGGKGIDSVKDFAKRVKDIFLRLIADIAAAWVTSKIFKLPANFGGGFNVGDFINGGGFGGGQGQGTGGTGGGIVQSVIQKGVVEGIKDSALGKAVSNSAAGKAVATWWAKNVTGQYFAAGNLGFKGPGVMNYGQAPATTTTSAAPAASSAGGIPAWGGAAVMAVVSFMAGLQEKSQMKKIMRAREEMMANFSPEGSESLGLDSTFIGSLETGIDGVERMYAAVDKRLVVALKEANAITGGLGLRMAMNGEHVHLLTGNVEKVRAALEGAQITGFAFAGSLETAIEKGNGLRVNIEGNSEIIKQALTSAAEQGDLAFRQFTETASGASAVLTGDIGKWQSVLQDFVNIAVQAAIAGVGNIAGAANSATNAFERMAAAARSVPSVGGSNPFGGRDGMQKFAAGGITSGPSIAGEAGPEAIVPLGGGRSIPVKNLNGGSSAKSEKLLRLIYQEVRKQNTRILALERA